MNGHGRTKGRGMMTLRSALAKTAVIGTGATLAIAMMAGPVAAAEPNEQACVSEFMADGVRQINQYYSDFAQDKTDNLEPGSWAKGNEVYGGIVGFAQDTTQGQPGFGDFMQGMQAGALSPYFPGLCDTGD